MMYVACMYMCATRPVRCWPAGRILNDLAVREHITSRYQVAPIPMRRRRSLIPTLLLDPGVDHKAAIAPRSIQIHGFARALRKRGSIAFCLRGPIKRGFAGPQNPSSSHSARVERTRAAENLRRSCRPPSLSAVPGKRATAAIERVPRRFEI